MKQRKYTRFSPQELQLLIFAVKANEPQAITALCQEYQGMITRLCSRPHIVSVLGYNEAVNSCYVYLLELAFSYKGNNWKEFPGLIYLYTKRMLHREYLREIGHKTLSAALPEELPLIDETASLELEDINFKTFLESLSPNEQLVTKLFIFKGLNKNEIAKYTGFSLRTIYNLRKRIITKFLKQNK